MKNTIVRGMGILSALCAAAACVADTDTPASQVGLPKKEKMHLYLLMGQSNMAGRGRIGAEDKTAHPRVMVLTATGVWEPAVEPITRDRTNNLGVGPGLTFGKTMAEADTSVTIGLVPCAVGGTPLVRWQKGGDLYERAVKRAALAMKNGTLKGMIWHQGESDSTIKTNAETYGVRLARMITDLRADLDSPGLPVVVGELGEFFIHRPAPKNPYAATVNQSLMKLPEDVPLTACASSAGLKDKGDEVHFTAAAQHEFGRRYAAEMLRLQAEPRK